MKHDFNTQAKPIIERLCAQAIMYQDDLNKVAEAGAEAMEELKKVCEKIAGTPDRMLAKKELSQRNTLEELDE